MSSMHEADGSHSVPPPVPAHMSRIESPHAGIEATSSVQPEVEVVIQRKPIDTTRSIGCETPPSITITVRDSRPQCLHVSNDVFEERVPGRSCERAEKTARRLYALMVTQEASLARYHVHEVRQRHP